MAIQNKATRHAVKDNGALASVWSALHEEDAGPQIKLWCRRAQQADEAISMGIDATSSLREAVADVDLLVLDAPSAALVRLCAAAIEAGLPPGCLITDLGSVKVTPHAMMHELLSGHAHAFIGSHPITSLHYSGIHSASAHSFEGVTCLLSNDGQAPPQYAEDLERFWQFLGCHVAWLSAVSHDALVARISHLPHIMAAAAAHVCLYSPNLGLYGGMGLSAITRAAAGDPSLWNEILYENREAIHAPLRELVRELQHMLQALEAGDQEMSRQWLTAAKDRRDRLNAEV